MSSGRFSRFTAVSNRMTSSRVVPSPSGDGPARLTAARPPGTGSSIIVDGGRRPPELPAWAGSPPRNPTMAAWPLGPDQAGPGEERRHRAGDQPDRLADPGHRRLALLTMQFV
jgi:hypothetical protein